MKSRENASFPIDQRTVAIKGKDFETCEVEHVRGTQLGEKSFWLSHLQNTAEGDSGFLRVDFYCRISSGCNNSKLRADSAGKTISLFPVKAAPPAPAPAPAAKPIAAPLPPPARPPINPPRAAPPPANTAVRLPFPFSVKVFAAARTRRLEPFTLMESSRTSRSAPPLNLPSGLASTTVPVTCVSRGIATASPTITSRVTVPVKVSPGWLSLEPTADPSRTVSSVLAGTISGSLRAS